MLRFSAPPAPCGLGSSLRFLDTSFRPQLFCDQNRLPCRASQSHPSDSMAGALCRVQRACRRDGQFLRKLRFEPHRSGILVSRLRYALRWRTPLRGMSAFALSVRACLRRVRVWRRFDPSPSAFQARWTPPSGAALGSPPGSASAHSGGAGGRGDLPGPAPSSPSAPARLQPGARTPACC